MSETLSANVKASSERLGLLRELAATYPADAVPPFLMAAIVQESQLLTTYRDFLATELQLHPRRPLVE